MSNSPHIKGQINWHLEEFSIVGLFARKIVFKIECNNALSIMHWIVGGSLLVINDLVVIVWDKTNWNGNIE
jgi:hypothetical protein